MVSIVIPVYNVMKYLNGCLESIKAQTYEDWECILIDDGSTDNSGYICDEYSERDSRFKVFHIPNGGVGNARNLGIEKISGKWVAFIDSDDTISPTYIESLVDAAENYNSDLTVTRYSIENENTSQIKDYNFIPGFFLRQEMGTFFLKQTHHFFYSSCYKLYKAEILLKNPIRFATDINLGEDLLFSTSFLSYITSVAFINGGKYCYLQHKGSLIQRERKFTETYSLYQQFLNIYSKEIYGRFSKAMDLYLGRELVTLLELVLTGMDSLPINNRKKILKQLDYKFYKKYKECISWKEWIMKQLLIFRFSKSYLYLRTKALQKA